jgi:hypothetical protein
MIPLPAVALALSIHAQPLSHIIQVQGDTFNSNSEPGPGPGPSPLPGILGPVLNGIIGNLMNNGPPKPRVVSPGQLHGFYLRAEQAIDDDYHRGVDWNVDHQIANTRDAEEHLPPQLPRPVTCYNELVGAYVMAERGEFSAAKADAREAVICQNQTIPGGINQDNYGNPGYGGGVYGNGYPHIVPTQTPHNTPHNTPHPNKPTRAQNPKIAKNTPPLRGRASTQSWYNWHLNIYDKLNNTGKSICGNVITVTVYPTGNIEPATPPGNCYNFIKNQVAFAQQQVPYPDPTCREAKLTIKIGGRKASFNPNWRPAGC